MPLWHRKFQFSHPLAGMTDSFIFKQTIKDIKGSCNAADAAGFWSIIISCWKNICPRITAAWCLTSKKLCSIFPSSRRTIKHVCSLVILGRCLCQTASLRDRTILRQPLQRLRWVEWRPLWACKTAYLKTYLLEPDLTPDNVIIVGDTPNDILCAQAIKARSLIILAGSTYNTEELKSYNPWQIIPELPDDPRDFAALLDKN